VKTGLIAFSETGMALGKSIADSLSADDSRVSLTRCEAGCLAVWTREHFTRDDRLIFIGSCGIAVRAIAPHLKDKTSDPAVVVVDEAGRFCIALLSGHIGGANAFAEKLALRIGAVPVITTATDVHGTFAVDTWAVSRGLTVANPELIKRVSARLLAGEPIAVKSLFSLSEPLPEGLIQTDGPCDVVITCLSAGDEGALRLVPPAVTLGIGTKKGIGADAIDAAFQRLLEQEHVHSASIRGVCSIDLKSDEPGILAFCRRRALPFHTFSADALARVPGDFTSSDFVRSVTGVDNVCERSAVLGSGEGGKLLVRRTAFHGVTMALAVSPFPLQFQQNGETQ